jgi:mannose-6-phosphate isomerase-like protein (cupin superfamily)
MGIQFLERGDGTGTNLGYEFVGEELGGFPACVIFVDAGPGEGPSLHRHTYTELFFVLEGEATFTDGKRERVVRAGTTVVVPPGHAHAFVNSGSGRLRQIDVHLNGRFETEWL